MKINSMRCHLISTSMSQKVSHTCSSHMSKLSRPTRPIQLILDFDGTLTQKDTMHVVASAGYKTQRERNEARSIDSRQLPRWDQIVQAYIDDFSAHARTYKPQKELRKTIDEELEWLNSLKSIEVASAERVDQAGVFDAVASNDMKNAALEALNSGEVKLRSGWESLLSTVYHANQLWYGKAPSTDLSAVISVNWSQIFVKNMLLTGARAAYASDTQSQNIGAVESMEVYANEIPSVRSSANDKLPATELRTNEDKVKQLLQLKKNVSQLDRTPLCVYLGDSATDLGCLLTADLGICIRDEPMSSGQKDLAETCQRLNVSVNTIKNLSAEELTTEVMQRNGTVKTSLFSSGRLWYVASFEEIHSTLQRLLYHD